MRAVIAFGAGVLVGFVLRSIVVRWRWRRGSADRLDIGTLERRQMSIREWQ